MGGGTSIIIEGRGSFLEFGRWVGEVAKRQATMASAAKSAMAAVGFSGDDEDVQEARRQEENEEEEEKRREEEGIGKLKIEREE
eukprot:748336-Hanusia_phi.AAC.1